MVLYFAKAARGALIFRLYGRCLTAWLIKTLGRGTWVIKMKSNSHSPPSVRRSIRPSSSCSTRSLCTRFIIKLELYYFNKTPRDPFCPVLTGLLAPLPSPHVSFSVSPFALSHSQLQSFCAFGHAPFALRLINMIIMDPCREHFIIRLSSNAAQQWNKELSLCCYWFFRVTNSADLIKFSLREGKLSKERRFLYQFNKR